MPESNRFGKYAESNAYDTFVDTYVPIPFEEMMKVGMMKKDESDKAHAALEKTYEDTQNIKYAPNTVDEKYIKERVIPATKEIFDKYNNQDLTNPIILRQLKLELNSKIDKNRVAKIQETYQGWKEHESQKQKLATEGKLSPFEQDQITGWDTATKGVYYGMSDAYVDPIKELQERLFAPIHDSTLSTHKDDQGNVFVKSGVDQRTIDKVTKDNLGNYLNTTTGKNAIKAMRASTGIGSDQKSDAEMLAYAIQKAGDPYLRHNDKIEHMRIDKNKDNNSNQFQNVSNTQSIRNIDLNPMGKDKIGHDINEATDPVKLMKSGFYDSKGNLILSGHKKLVFVSSPGSPTTGMGASGHFIEDDDGDKQAKVQRDLIDHIKKTTPELSKLSDLEVMRSYAQAYKNAESVDYNEYLFDNMGKGAIKKPITDMVIDDLGGRKLVNAQTGKHSAESINNLNDIFDKLDVPKDDRKRSNIHITGTVPGKNAYKATVFAKDGPHDFMISTNQKEQYIFKPIEEVTRLANMGVLGDKELHTANGRRLIVRTKLVPGIDNNGQSTHNFSSTIISGDGYPILRGEDPNAEIPLNVLEWESVQQLTHPYTQQSLNNAGQQDQTESESEE
jgi:hypothetical protein